VIPVEARAFAFRFEIRGRLDRYDLVWIVIAENRRISRIAIKDIYAGPDHHPKRGMHYQRLKTVLALPQHILGTGFVVDLLESKKNRRAIIPTDNDRLAFQHNFRAVGAHGGDNGICRFRLSRK
jgi:hypothetical protein